MAMTWLQQMFTPERSGSYQWEDRVADSGEVSTGDIEDLVFKPRAHRGPGNTVGQNLMPSAVERNPDGMGIRPHHSQGMPEISISETDVTQTPSGETISSFTEDAGALPSISSAMSQAFRGFPQRHAMKPGMSTGMIPRMQGEGGIRAIKGAGMLGGPRNTAMAKVNPGTRPGFGFNPSAFNQGSTQKQDPGYLRKLFDYAKLFGKGLGGGAAMMLHSPDAGANSDQQEVSNTGVPAAWGDFSGMAQDYNNWDPMNPVLEIPQTQPTTPMIPNITSGSGARFAEPENTRPGTFFGSRRMY